MTIENVQKDQIQHTGEYGNATRMSGFAVLNAEAAGGVARPLKIPAGTRVDGIRIPHGAFGAGVTMGVGFDPVDPAEGPTADPVYFAGQASVATAGVLEAKAFVPITFDYDVYLTLTTAGATSAGNDIRADVLVEAVHLGYK